MSVPIEVMPEPPVSAIEEAVAKPGIQGRSLGQIAWSPLKRDKVAMISLVLIIVILVVAIFAPLIIRALGVSTDDFNIDLLDQETALPNGPWSGASREHWLGIEPANGRDVFARIVVGARVSLVIAIAATFLSVVLGVAAGVAAGYYGGSVDTVISRIMDVMLAFPVLLFAIAMLVIFTGVESFAGLSDVSLRIALMIFIIGFFSWAYIGRVIRGQVLSLREKEFIDASRSLGAKNSRILNKELLPNLVAPILVYATLTIPTNILFEAALSFLGVGVQEPLPSWGKMLSTAQSTYSVNPFYMFIPGIAIFITVLAFNLFGDGLRDALDPKSTR